MFTDSGNIARTYWTIVSWKLALRTRAVELYTTNTAEVVVWHVPPPCGDSMVRRDLDLHIFVDQ